MKEHQSHGKLNVRRMVASLILWVPVFLWGGGGVSIGADTNTAKIVASFDAREKEECIRNLKAIYQAIQAYQTRKHDLPNWLSDLVPEYLADANVLMCPVCRRTGRIEEPPLADPKIPSSYLFEFCPVPLGDHAPMAPERTRRDWKRRQMGLLGSVVPMVRCRHHSPVLNVAFDGQIYESPPAWEMAFTNRISYEALLPARLFAGEGPRGKAAPPAKKPGYAPRDPNAKPSQIDLSRFYNAMLTAPMHRQTNNTLSKLPRGLQVFGGVEFDVRGVVHLASKTLTNRNYPVEVKNIPVKQKCKQLHFLHAAAVGTPRDLGTKIGAYLVKYAGNPARLEIPIQYGTDVLDWHKPPNESAAVKGPVVVWTGTNVFSKTESRTIRVFKTTWNNLLPDVAIENIDFVSTMENPAPFLIAITASE